MSPVGWGIPGGSHIGLARNIEKETVWFEGDYLISMVCIDPLPFTFHAQVQADDSSDSLTTTTTPPEVPIV